MTMSAPAKAKAKAPINFDDILATDDNMFDGPMFEKKDKKGAKPVAKTIQSTQLVVATTRLAPPAASTSLAILDDHLASGVLSAEKAEQLWGQVLDVCSKSVKAIDDAHQSMQVAISEFRISQRADIAELAAYAAKLFAEITGGKNADKDMVENAKFVFYLSGQVQTRRYEAVKQLSELHKLDLDNLLGNYKSAMVVMYDCRLKEIDALSKMLQTAQGAEKEAAQNAIAYHNQQLLAENQQFEQALILAKFQSERMEKAREFELKAHVQAEELDLKKALAAHAMATDTERLELEKTTQAQSHALAAREADDRKELAGRYLDIQDAAQEHEFEAKMKKAANDYALGLGQLQNDKEREQLKSAFLNRQAQLHHEARVMEISSSERQRLAQIRSEEYINRLTIDARKAVELRGIDARTQARLAEIHAHQQIENKKIDNSGGGCSIS